ncbi:MAG: amino acid permease, partial [Lewinella sp.]|nr:amino acid permease [Lewinella sp.]
SEYLTFFIPLTEASKVLVAAGTIAVLTLINVRGVDTSQWVINVFTSLKLLAILLIVLVAVLFMPEQAEPVMWSLTEKPPDHLLSALLIALVGVLWSFGGWHHASYLAGEAVEPQRTVPRAMLLGAVIVTVTYVLVNAAYLSLLPVDQIISSERVAGDAVEAVVAGGGRWVALAISISVFGTIAIYTMSAPRIYFAMARDGVFFSRMATIHERFKTPANAMLIQSAWAILLLFFWGTFDNLITYVTFIDLAFMGLAGAGVFLFRRRLPLAERTYRVWGYPVIPAIFVLITAAFVLNTLWERPVQAVAGLIVLGAGVAVYWRIK